MCSYGREMRSNRRMVTSSISEDKMIELKLFVGKGHESAKKHTETKQSSQDKIRKFAEKM